MIYGHPNYYRNEGPATRFVHRVRKVRDLLTDRRHSKDVVRTPFEGSIFDGPGSFNQSISAEEFDEMMGYTHREHVVVDDVASVIDKVIDLVQDVVQIIRPRSRRDKGDIITIVRGLHGYVEDRMRIDSNGKGRRQIRWRGEKPEPNFHEEG